MVTGLGNCDVEKATKSRSYSVYRIASISKSITAALAMSLHERGLFDLDRPITYYLPDWPQKVVDGEQVGVMFKLNDREFIELTLSLQMQN